MGGKFGLIRRLVALVWIGLTMLSTAWAAPFLSETVVRADWPQYENGANIMEMPQVPRILQRFEEKEGIVVVIQHPANETDRQWAVNLGNWLVSFGIPSRYFQLETNDALIGQLIILLDNGR